VHVSVFRSDLFEGQVMWITGGGSGIGAGIAAAFAAHGARVALSGRKADKLERVAEGIIAAGGEALVVPADVRQPEALAASVAQIDARWGRLDHVVCCAAGNFLAPAVALSANGFGTVVDIDLKGTFNTCKAAFPLLSKAGGTITNISATLQYTGTPLQIHASAAKAGIDALTRNLAVEWGALKIRVNAVAPGPIDDTEGMARLAPAGAKQKLTALIPLQRFGKIDEIADTVLFLASPASAYTTGAVFVVDGGQWLATSGLGTAFSG
jgi:2,4-dienoyl-CoA reductase [(3E)-enoyl-CoA-producing], peroxisomal